ncbi:uncharacterized protein A1O9_12072 [Exophiala aquamarina CBS 119918]|uniref:Peptidase S9 prolyl oligopeptidase catalytic domain-containing protein n=1 Tax=Exophiala aquamarina CBS 119918 TaxID=1182545 RepID=A0A072P814_9EURO|nr:uncharacterized protein A1O9_12072 [Exophiala aquamarina CBS 119918]KEF51735.1 hypothetical protein A1O9_12072 [Exophiala aquamarina CBS 119918]
MTDNPNLACNNSTWITQWIDHSNHSLGTFQQQVQVVTDFYKPGGPILLFQGEESIAMICVLGGIAAAIEHRYFGNSTPFGPDQSYTQKGFRYLTLDNIMDDTALFIEQMQKNISGASKSPAIVASGSYGGFLVTALRLNRPNSIYGAIAAAPPILGFLTGDGNVAERFNWWNWISNAVSDKSAEAASVAKKAFTTLQQVLQSGKSLEP